MGYGACLGVGIDVGDGIDVDVGGGVGEASSVDATGVGLEGTTLGTSVAIIVGDETAVSWASSSSTTFSRLAAFSTVQPVKANSNRQIKLKTVFRSPVFIIFLHLQQKWKSLSNDIRS